MRRAGRLLVLVLIGVAPAACGGAQRRDVPATIAVRAYVGALRADDPSAAWELLSAEARAATTFDRFAAAWRASRRERERQAVELEEGMRGDPDLGERATVRYRDGKTVHLERAEGRWALERGMVSRAHAAHPVDAVEMLSDALQARSYRGVMGILSSRRRDKINEMVSAFATSLLQHKRDRVFAAGKDRVALRWDDDGMQYEVILVREHDEWRVDDFDVRPIPQPAP
jgi:hypothetical protein